MPAAEHRPPADSRDQSDADLYNPSQTRSAAAVASTAKPGADADLFATPLELCCPITLFPFLDPVRTPTSEVVQCTRTSDN